MILDALINAGKVSLLLPIEREEDGLKFVYIRERCFRTLSVCGTAMRYNWFSREQNAGQSVRASSSAER